MDAPSACTASSSFTSGVGGRGAPGAVAAKALMRISGVDDDPTTTALETRRRFARRGSRHYCNDRRAMWPDGAPAIWAKVLVRALVARRQVAPLAAGRRIVEVRGQ